MDIELFIILYSILIFILVLIEVYLLSNDKIKYIRISCDALNSIIKEIQNDNVNLLAKEIEQFYIRFKQEKPKIKKFFPDVVSWIDSIIYRIDLNYKYCKFLKENINFIKSARDVLAEKYPYSKFKSFQQDILLDINKIETEDNKIVVDNIIGRIENEFTRLTNDNNKNERNNRISTLTGIIGILVSIIMALINFIP